MMQQKRIAILLAAYNGELYLKEQMDSLFAQQNQDWDLIVSDDCSVDSTYDILRWYKDKYKERVILLNNDMPSGSSTHIYAPALPQIPLFSAPLPTITEPFFPPGIV